MRIALAFFVLAACGPSASQPIEAPVEKPIETPPVEAPVEVAKPPPSLLSTGYMHQCCVAPGDKLACNGSNARSEITIPEAKFKSVSAGLYTTCAIDDANAVQCWGEYAPKVAASGTTYLHVAAGSKFACALTSEREVQCWSQGGDFPAPPKGQFRDLVAGHDHACALADSGEVTCFGRPADREPMPCLDLEDVDPKRCEGITSVARNWTAAPAELRATLIAAGSGHSCALTTDGSVTCWGAMGHGDGNSIFSTHLFPPAELGKDVVKLTAGGGSSCALTADGEARCWGHQTDLPGVFTDIDGGSSGTCGVRQNGEMECFTYSSFAGAKLDTTPLTCEPKRQFARMGSP